MNIASMFRLDNMDLTTLFSMKELDEVVTGDNQLYSPATRPPSKSRAIPPDINDFIKTVVLPPSPPEVLKPAILSPDIPKDFDRTNKDILKEQKKQTEILETGFDKPDLMESTTFIEAKREKQEIFNFKQLEDSLKGHQSLTTEKLSEDVTKKFEDVGDNIVKAITLTGGTGGESIIEDAADFVDFDGSKGKKPSKKGGKFKRVLSKVKGGAKKAGKTLTKPIVTAASLGTSLKVGGLGAKLGTGAGTALTGGAGASTALVGTGGVLLAGAGGYLVGTGINKVAKEVAGREDWLFGWIGDVQEEKALNEARKNNLGKWGDKLSPSVITMMGGEDNFEAEKFIGLRFKGLIKHYNGKWYTKGEYDLMQIDRINKTVGEAEAMSIGFPTNLLDLKDNVSEKDKEAFKKLMAEKEKLLSNYSSDLLAGFVKEGSDIQLKGFLESYQELEKEMKVSSGKTKAYLLDRMKADAEIIKEITGGMSVEELKSSYKSNVADVLEVRVKEIQNREKAKTATQLPEIPITTTEVINLAEKQEDTIKKLKANKITSITKEIEVTKQILASTPNETEKIRLQEKIKRLQTKKSDIEGMSDKQYEDWLNSAVKETRQAVAEMKRSRQRDLFKSAANINIEASNLIQESNYPILQRGIEKAPAVKPTPVVPPSAEIVSSIADREKAQKMVTNETLRTEGRTPNQEVKVIQVPVPSQAPPTPNRRQLMVDDPKVDLLRTAL